MDYRSLTFPRLALIDPTSAINLHANRETTERRREADLIGAGGEANVLIELIFDAVEFGSSKITLVTHGDGTALFTSSTKLDIYDHTDSLDENDRAFSSSSFDASTTYDKFNGAETIDTPDGFTESVYALGVGGTWWRVEVLATGDDALIVEYDRIGQGLSTDLGTSAEKRYYDLGPWQYGLTQANDIFTTTVGTAPKDCADDTFHDTVPDDYHRLRMSVPRVLDDLSTPGGDVTFRHMHKNETITMNGAPVDPVLPCYSKIGGQKGLGGTSHWDGNDMAAIAKLTGSPFTYRPDVFVRVESPYLGWSGDGTGTIVTVVKFG